MRLIDSLTVEHEGERRTIELLVGDLAAIPPEHAVDLLVVSAFPGSYVPSPGTLIRALDQRGLRVRDLAADMEQDLREASSCWLSKAVSRPDLNFERVLSFEPGYRGWEPIATVVGDIFRSIMPFTIGDPHVRRIAMPLVATGNQGADPPSTLEAVLDAATRWFKIGMPLETLKIVLFEGQSPERTEPLASVFARFAHTWRADAESRAGEVAAREHTDDGRRYDFFVSYAREDERHAKALVQRLQNLDPGLRIFLDQSELDTGSAWQHSIYEAIEASRRVVCLFSPDFVSSAVCKEEFNIGMLRHREEGGVLIPAYLRTATLPSYMRLVQYTDVREGNPAKLDRFAEQLRERAMTANHVSAPSGFATSAPPHEQHATIVMDALTAADVTDLLRMLDAESFEIQITVRARRTRAGSDDPLIL